MQKLIRKYTRLSLIIISVIIFLTGCIKCDDEYYKFCVPAATGTNIVTFMQTNGDTLQSIDFSKVDEYCESGAKREPTNQNNFFKTIISIKYNSDYEKVFQADPLYNGALSFYLTIELTDSAFKSNYEINKLYIDFKNGHYSHYSFVNDSSTKLTISRYGKVLDKIEGDFKSKFVNNNNDSDSLIISCRFSAKRCPY